MSGKSDEHLYWRVEMACRAAWPALEEHDLGGWVARYSGDTIRRTGSLNPLPGVATLDAALLDRSEEFYGKYGRQPLVRLPDFLSKNAELLGQRAYRAEGQTLTLLAPDISALAPKTGNVAITPTPTAAWLTARGRIINGDQQVFAAMLGRIACPALFASIEVGGVVASIAYGVMVDRLLIVESVATEQAFKGRGLGRALLEAMMSAAGTTSAQAAALQVVADNEPALALYRRLGFSRMLYGYCYYRRALGRNP